MSDYYVYVYIDPRNYEEFYYGKGKGSRKDAHLSDTSDSAKAKCISEIKREGLSPIIRVIARNLTENEALLIEKTLLWKLGKWTTNISSGHFSEKFRPHNTLHKELSGFDYQNGLYYYNVGEGPHRNWNDYVEFGFISAGQGTRWRDAMLGFNPGDVFAAYLKRHGFVGIGQITAPAKMIRDVQIKSKRLLDLPLGCKNMDDNCNNTDLSEYVQRGFRPDRNRGDVEKQTGHRGRYRRDSLQVVNYHTGFLVHTPEGAALRIRYLLHQHEMLAQIGARAKNYVRENFLLTRHLREHLTLLAGLRYESQYRIKLS